MLKITLSSLLTLISFSYTKFANFWNVTCFVPNLTPVWPQSYELEHNFEKSFRSVRFPLSTDVRLDSKYASKAFMNWCSTEKGSFKLLNAKLLNINTL